MQNSGPRTRKYIYILWWWSTELAWLDSASPHNAAYLGPHLIFPSSCGGLSKISMQSMHYYHNSNNATRQSRSPTRSLGRSVGQSPTYRRWHNATHRRRRRNKAVASCYVTWLASAKYTLDHHAQPFGRGTCKKNDCGKQLQHYKEVHWRKLREVISVNLLCGLYVACLLFPLGQLVIRVRSSNPVKNR